MASPSATEDGESIRAGWVVGADGAGSAVRKAIGLSFDGNDLAERFVATNVYFDFAAAGYGLTMMVIDDQYGAIIVKIARDGLWRCTYMEDGALPEQSFMARLPAAYRELLPSDGDYAVARAAPYRMHQRSAPRYRVGRGAAGRRCRAFHQSDRRARPDLRLFDCYALYPALAAVILDGADAEVLDRYSDARRDMFLTASRRRRSATSSSSSTPTAAARRWRRRSRASAAMASDDDFRLERLMFNKSLETPLLLGEPVS